MIAYTYDPHTFEYLGIETIFESPLEQGTYLVPVNATLQHPTLPQEKNKTCVFSTASQTWSVLEDHRQVPGADGKLCGGTPYWLVGDSCESPARYMEVLGPLPTGALLKAPEKTLSEVKAEKISQINTETSAKILTGFTYKGYKYSYDRDDQQNFADTAVIAQQCVAQGTSRLVNWNSYNTAGGLVVQTFTPTEFLDVYLNGALTHKQTCMLQATTRKDKVQKATSISQVESI